MSATPEERRRRVLDCLRAASGDELSVGELAAVLGVSAMTVRRDLAELARSRLVVRTHGGAMLAERVSSDRYYTARMRQEPEKKVAIGAAAAGLVQPGDTILIDAGSTTLQFARSLPPGLPLTILTNDVQVAVLAAANRRWTVQVLGGTVRADNYSVVGAATLEQLRHLKPPKAFLAATCVHPQAGIGTNNPYDAEVKRLMVRRSGVKVLLADSTKFGRICPHPFCTAAELDIIVTDAGVPAELRRELTAQGPRFVIARGATQGGDQDG